MNIHPTAVVHPGAVLGEGVTVGPYSVIGGNCSIGSGTRIWSHVSIKSFVEIGEENEIFPFAVVGEDPQHTGYKGQETRLIVGNGNHLREFVTLHRGTVEGGGITKVGDGCLLMACAHVAHDCHVGDGVVLANSVEMGGHCRVGDHAFVKSLTAIHQFVRVGEYSLIKEASAVAQDVPPYAAAAGNRAELLGLNEEAMKTENFSPETRLALKEAYGIIFNSGLSLIKAAEKIRDEIKGVQEVDRLLKFVESSERGICR